MGVQTKHPASRCGLLVGLVTAIGCGAAQPVVGRTDSCPSQSTVTASAASTPPALAPSRKKLDDVADELLRPINAKDGAGVVASFGESMRRKFPVEKAGPFIASLIDDKGPLESLSRDSPIGDERHGVYRFKARRGDWRVELKIDDGGRVIWFGVTEAPPTAPFTKSTLDLGLPYRGQWRVYWGGDTPALNTHLLARDQNQRRAADLDLVGADGKTYRGSGKSNADYYAYGRDVLAVADGVVTMVVDGVPENEPGETNRHFLPGDVVVVQHTDHLFSVYAHLQPGKLRVKVGMAVKKGAVVGSCGNSGNSSEPHLHFQLQDGPLFDNSTGVEPVFKNVQVVHDGKPSRVAEYSFLQGDLVGEVETK